MCRHVPTVPKGSYAPGIILIDSALDLFNYYTFYRRTLTHQLQATFEDIAAKGEIDLYKDFLVFAILFSLFRLIKLSTTKGFHILAQIFSKSFAEYVLYVVIMLKNMTLKPYSVGTQKNRISLVESYHIYCL